MLGAGDPGIDEQHVEHFAAQLLDQHFQRSGFVHIQRFDPNAVNGPEVFSVLRITHGGGDLPALLGQSLNQPKPEATRCTDDEGGFFGSGHEGFLGRLRDRFHGRASTPLESFDLAAYSCL